MQAIWPRIKYVVVVILAFFAIDAALWYATTLEIRYVFIAAGAALAAGVVAWMRRDDLPAISFNQAAEEGAVDYVPSQVEEKNTPSQRCLQIKIVVAAHTSKPALAATLHRVVRESGDQTPGTDEVAVTANWQGDRIAWGARATAYWSRTPGWRRPVQQTVRVRINDWRWETPAQ